MTKLNLKRGDKITLDPCYVKSVKDDIGDMRFDALKHIKTLHDGDDGVFDITVDSGQSAPLGVDSGRIWTSQVEFPVEVEVEAGLSGFILEKGEK